MSLSTETCCWCPAPSDTRCLQRATSPGIPRGPTRTPRRRATQRLQVLRDPQGPQEPQKLQAVTSPTTETVIPKQNSTYCTKNLQAPKKAPPTTHPTPLESRLNPLPKRALPRVPAFLLVSEISSLTWSSFRGSQGFLKVLGFPPVLDKGLLFWEGGGGFTEVWGCRVFFFSSLFLKLLGFPPRSRSVEDDQQDPMGISQG